MDFLSLIGSILSGGKDQMKSAQDASGMGAGGAGDAAQSPNPDHKGLIDMIGSLFKGLGK